MLRASPVWEQERVRLPQWAYFEAGRVMLPWLRAALYVPVGQGHTRVPAGRGLMWDPHPEGSQEELSRDWMELQSPGGGKLREERRRLFPGVAIQGHHQEGHLQNPLKSARRAVASCLPPLVRGEPVLPISSLCWVLCPSSPPSWHFLLIQKMLLGTGVW